MKEQFTIESVTVYTLKSAHGVQEFKGYDKLKEHGENLLGAFVDRLTSENTGHYTKDKMRNFEFIMNNRQDMETIFAVQDAIKDLEPDQCDCENNY